MGHQRAQSDGDANARNGPGHGFDECRRLEDDLRIRRAAPSGDCDHHGERRQTGGQNPLQARRRRAFCQRGSYGPDDQFRFRTLYKYDDSGKLTQETQLGQDEVVRSKIVYAYDKNGKQTGYTVYDAAGKVIRRMPETAPKRTPASRRR